MTYSATLKRAARFNPAWKPAKLYRIAIEDGTALTDGAGGFQYDLIDDTFGMRDWQREDSFTTLEPYNGDANLLLITNETPDKFDLIQWNGDYYNPLEVMGGDGYGGTIKVRVKALPETETITIRNNTV
ncbi:hypothetical protein NNA36_06775 [Shimia sp. CNT1-13L.2]|uniref:hypothetical protein n=1 Tax=Shimia sp. CNT1-13L.2 TaxID=2959663 RepID=UPI0020CB910A|nr:hypothetical protein [Shimia sp. CNT1-13L.2]MCP9481664.1 hypothetical protein [Shimia sp. CNT1-13L.2]